MVSSTGSVVVPLSADVTATNVQDNPVYQWLTSCMPLEIIKKTHSMVSDPGYDDPNLYELSMQMGFQLVYSVVDTKQTPQKKDFNWLISMSFH